MAFTGFLQLDDGERSWPQSRSQVSASILVKIPEGRIQNKLNTKCVHLQGSRVEHGQSDGAPLTVSDLNLHLLSGVPRAYQTLSQTGLCLKRTNV
jgi:Uma2 family endonuclease